MPGPGSLPSQRRGRRVPLPLLLLVVLGVLAAAYFYQRARRTPGLSDEERCTREGLPRACFRAARAVEERGLRLRADRLYERCCEGGEGVCCFNAGVLRMQRGDRRSAVSSFRRGCDRGYARACTNLAALQREAGQTRTALGTARRACSLGQSLGCANLALALSEAGQPAQAAAAARRARRIAPHDPAVRALLGALPESASRPAP